MFSDLAKFITNNILTSKHLRNSKLHKEAIIANKCITHWGTLDVPPLCSLNDLFILLVILCITIIHFYALVYQTNHKHVLISKFPNLQQWLV